MKNNVRLWLSLFTLALFAGGCGKETQNLKFNLNDVPFVLEAPLFEGPNTAQHEIKFDLSQLGESIDPEKTKIKSARLVFCELNAEDGKNFNLMSSFGIQMAGDGSEMTQMGVLNPVPADVNKVRLKMSEEADLKAFFEHGTFIVLVDAGLKEDLMEENISFTGTFKFELEIN